MIVRGVCCCVCLRISSLSIHKPTGWSSLARIVRLGRAFTFLTFAGMCRSLLGENTTRMLHFKRKNHWEAPISALTQIGQKTGHAWVGSFWGNKRRATDAPSRIILLHSPASFRGRGEPTL